MGLFGRWLANRLGAAGGTAPGQSLSISPLPRSCHESNLIDLVDEWGLTFSLLDDTRAWRERAVYKFVLRDSDHVDVSTAYQIRLPVEMVHPYDRTARPGDLLRVALPFTVRANDLLLDIDFGGVRDNPIALRLRQEIAEMQAQYIAHVDGRPLGDQPLGGALWVAVSSYTPFDWREHYGRAKPSAIRRLVPGFRDFWRTRALVEYLNADLKLDIVAKDITRWISRTADASQLLATALGEPQDMESSSECILLAIPFMPVRPRRITDIDILVDEFCTSVEKMDPPTREVLAEYGRRWEVIVDTVIPIGQSCTVKMSEQRPWINAPSPIMKQEVAFGDAATHMWRSEPLTTTLRFIGQGSAISLANARATRSSTPSAKRPKQLPSTLQTPTDPTLRK